MGFGLIQPLFGIIKMKSALIFLTLFALASSLCIWDEWLCNTSEDGCNEHSGCSYGCEFGKCASSCMGYCVIVDICPTGCCTDCQEWCYLDNEGSEIPRESNADCPPYKDNSCHS